MTSSHQKPDERDLLDFADAVAAGQNPQPLTDEERTYLHVQRAMQGESAAIPSTTKQSTWEHVMSTLALTPEAPVSNRTRKQQGLSSPPRAGRARRMQWTPLASVAAALLVIIACYGVFTLFAFITLPVEFDASKRALAWIEQRGIVTRSEHDMAKDALKWAAMTYVVAALASLATLAYYAFIFFGNRD